MANKLVIEIRHAAAARAATDGNTHSVGDAPEPAANVKTKPPKPAPPKPNKNEGAQEPDPPVAQENIHDDVWRKAERSAMLKMHTQLTGKK